MNKFKNQGGLLVDESTTPPAAAGFIFNFGGHGAFAPDGKVGELTQAEIDQHNKILADAQWAGMLKTGRGLLYLCNDRVTDWGNSHSLSIYHAQKSFHNFAGKDGRTDVWFMLDGSRWHGVNIGDNQMLRVKRCKS